MSDTPRTSEEWRRIQRLPDGRYSSQITDEDLAHGMCNFAKQLERELDKAREEISDLQGDVEAWKRETMIANARLRGEKHPDDNGAISPKEIIPKLQRELADERKEREQWADECDKNAALLKEAVELGELAMRQRDTLEVLLKDCLPFCEPMRQKIIDEALAAVKGGGAMSDRPTYADLADMRDRALIAEKKNEQLERELAELREQLEDFEIEATNAINDIVRVKYQRDTLAEALGYLMQSCESIDCEAMMPAAMPFAYIKAKQALAAVKGGSHE